MRLIYAIHSKILDSPFIFPGPVLFLPDFFYIVDLFSLAIHEGITMFCRDDEFVFITFNVCRCT